MIFNVASCDDSLTMSKHNEQIKVNIGGNESEVLKSRGGISIPPLFLLMPDKLT